MVKPLGLEAVVLVDNAQVRNPKIRFSIVLIRSFLLQVETKFTTLAEYSDSTRFFLMIKIYPIIVRYYH